MSVELRGGTAQVPRDRGVERLRLGSGENNLPATTLRLQWQAPLQRVEAVPPLPVVGDDAGHHRPEVR